MGEGEPYLICIESCFMFRHVVLKGKPDELPEHIIFTRVLFRPGLCVLWIYGGEGIVYDLQNMHYDLPVQQFVGRLLTFDEDGYCAFEKFSCLLF